MPELSASMYTVTQCQKAVATKNSICFMLSDVLPPYSMSEQQAHTAGLLQDYKSARQKKRETCVSCRT